MSNGSIRYSFDLTRLTQIERLLPEQIEELLDTMATNIVTDIVLSFNSSPPGITYRRKAKNGSYIYHTASQPGYPPNVDLGTLRASIGYRKEGRHRRVIFDGVEYGLFLEVGTENMAARPFFAPVFATVAERYAQSLRDMFGDLGL